MHRTCLAPGCRIPADRCDLDHHVPHPRGPTSPPNLGPFCRPFHQVKTFTDTLVEPDRDGGLRITLPSGRSYHRPAEPILDHPWLVDDRPVHDQPAEGQPRNDQPAGGQPDQGQVTAEPPEDDIPPF